MGKEPCSLKLCGEKEYYCTVELTLHVIGGKWKSIIIYRLGEEGTLRFSAIKRSIPNITQKMLTQQLRELEADGIVHREVFPQVPPKVEYSLTELGQTVLPVMKSMCGWGEKYAQWYKAQHGGQNLCDELASPDSAKDASGLTHHCSGS